MGQKTMQKYWSNVEALVDKIDLLWASLDNEDIILYILSGLPPSYQAFKTSIHTSLHPISLDNFYSLLYNEEIHITSDSTKEEHIVNQLALQSTRGCFSSTISLGRFYSQFGHRGGQQFSTWGGKLIIETQTCQICNKWGHSTFQLLASHLKSWSYPQTKSISWLNNYSSRQW